MTTIQGLELLWFDGSWQSLVEHAKQYLIRDRNVVYIECIDGADDCGAIMNAINYCSQSKTRWLSDCVITVADFLDFSIPEATVFCGYDAVWIVEGNSSSLSFPQFISYFAAESESDVPRLRSSVKVRGTWSDVAEWMRTNSVVCGLISGRHKLFVRLDT